MKKNKDLYFVPLGFDDEGKIQRAVMSKIENGDAITGYLLNKEQLLERVKQDLVENGVEVYKFSAKGKVFKKIELKMYN